MTFVLLPSPLLSGISASCYLFVLKRSAAMGLLFVFPNKSSTRNKGTNSNQISCTKKYIINNKFSLICSHLHVVIIMMSTPRLRICSRITSSLSFWDIYSCGRPERFRCCKPLGTQDVMLDTKSRSIHQEKYDCDWVGLARVGVVRNKQALTLFWCFTDGRGSPRRVSPLQP